MHIDTKIDSLDALKLKLREFVSERDWDKFHTPKNLSMALVAESAELIENFLWIDGESSHLLNQQSKEAVAEEIADILIYLVMISDKLDIDIYEAVNCKLKLNEDRYQVSKVRGSSRKYTDYFTED